MNSHFNFYQIKFIFPDNCGTNNANIDITYTRFLFLLFLNFDLIAIIGAETHFVQDVSPLL